MNEVKRQLDRKMGNMSSRKQYVMNSIHSRKQEPPTPKKPWMPSFIAILGIATTVFLTYLVYPQFTLDQTADNGQDEPVVGVSSEDKVSETLANYFVKTDETMYYLGTGNEYAAFEQTTTWLSHKYVQQISKDDGASMQNVYRITENEIQLVYTEMFAHAPIEINLETLDALPVLSIVLREPFKDGLEFDHKTMTYPVHVEMPFGRFEDAIMTTEMKDSFTEKIYYAEGYGLIKKEFTSADGYSVTSTLASVGEPPKEKTLANFPQQIDVMNTESGCYETFHLADLPFLQTYFLSLGGTVEDIEEMRYSPLHQNKPAHEYGILHYDYVKDICSLGLIQKTDNGITSLYLGEGVPEEVILFSPDLEKAMIRIHTSVSEGEAHPNHLALIDVLAMELIYPQQYPEFFETALMPIVEYEWLDANTIRIVTADVEEHSAEAFEAWRKLGHEGKATVKELVIRVE